MYNLLGDKKFFAIEIDIMKMTPHLWGKTSVWINEIQIGDFNDGNVLGPFLNSLANIAVGYEDLWDSEFEGLECVEIFNKIHPFYHDPNRFFELTNHEQEKLERFDKFLFQWGENFDGWAFKAVVQNKMCVFLWIQPARGLQNQAISDAIQCFNVKLKNVQVVYHQICELIPDEHWPSRLKKF